MVRIAVLVSGGGTNLQSLIDAIENKSIDGEIVLVVSNKKDAYGLERARKNNIKTLYTRQEEKIINQIYIY